LNVTTVEWAKDQFDRTTSPDRKQVYADILTELTGSKVAVPQAKPLSEQLIAENDRFVLALQAQQMLAHLPEAITLADSDENKLKDNPKFLRLHEQLLAEGFRQNGLRFEISIAPVFIVTYTNEQRMLDAVVSDRWFSREVGCRIIAHGRDGRMFSMSNVSDPLDPRFIHDFLIRGEHRETGAGKRNHTAADSTGRIRAPLPVRQRSISSGIQAAH
jgi:hypothetical protein